LKVDKDILEIFDLSERRLKGSVAGLKKVSCVRKLAAKSINTLGIRFC